MTDAIDWLEARPRRRDHAWVQRNGDETAVYNPDTGILHFLNVSALAIWELCDGETTAKEMAEAIDEVTGLGQEATAADVRATVTRLVSAGLISI